MANVTLLGASYTDVPAVTLPKTGGGTARFTDVSDSTAVASDVNSGKYVAMYISFIKEFSFRSFPEEIKHKINLFLLYVCKSTLFFCFTYKKSIYLCNIN